MEDLSWFSPIAEAYAEHILGYPAGFIPKERIKQIEESFLHSNERVSLSDNTVTYEAHNLPFRKNAVDQTMDKINPNRKQLTVDKIYDDHAQKVFASLIAREIVDYCTREWEEIEAKTKTKDSVSPHRLFDLL